jgi:hypothetical protein
MGQGNPHVLDELTPVLLSKRAVLARAKERRCAMKLITKLLTHSHRKSPRRGSLAFRKAAGRAVEGIYRLWPASYRGMARQGSGAFYPACAPIVDL